MLQNLTYGDALAHLQQGKLIARSGWHGKGMFVFKRLGFNTRLTTVLAEGTIPKGVKDYYELKHQPITPNDIPMVTFVPYLCLKAADDTIVTGWLASQTDMLAADWCVLDQDDLARLARP